MDLRAGLRLKSAVCDAEIMVIKVAGEGELTCGGLTMATDTPTARSSGTEDQMHGCVIGKRYVDETGSVEVLCVKSGDGSLYYAGVELMTKDTRKLPSSD